MFHFSNLEEKKNTTAAYIISSHTTIFISGDIKIESNNKTSDKPYII